MAKTELACLCMEPFNCHIELYTCIDVKFNNMCIRHGVYTSMINVHIFLREKGTLWVWMFYSCCNI